MFSLYVLVDVSYSFSFKVKRLANDSLFIKLTIESGVTIPSNPASNFVILVLDFFLAIFNELLHSSSEFNFSILSLISLCNISNFSKTLFVLFSINSFTFSKSLHANNHKITSSLTKLSFG